MPKVPAQVWLKVCTRQVGYDDTAKGAPIHRCSPGFLPYSIPRILLNEMSLRVVFRQSPPGYSLCTQCLCLGHNHHFHALPRRVSFLDSVLGARPEGWLSWSGPLGSRISGCFL